MTDSLPLNAMWSFDENGVFLVTVAMQMDNPSYWFAVAETFETKQEAEWAFLNWRAMM